MKKKVRASLQLNRETLHLLESSDTRQVLGGTSFTNGLNCRQSMPCSYIDNSAPESCLF